MFAEFVKQKREKITSRHKTSSAITKESAQSLIRALEAISKGENVDRGGGIKQRIQNRNFCLVESNNNKKLGQVVNREQIAVGLVETQ